MTPIPPRRSAAALVITALLALPGAADASAGAAGDDSPALGPGTATARTQAVRFVPEGPTAGTYCGKDYSQNSVGGDYCVRLKASASSPPQNVVSRGGSSWGDAGARAVAALALVLAAAGSTTVLRRRRAASGARGHRSPATT
jgi:hypothetical protein